MQSSERVTMPRKEVTVNLNEISVGKDPQEAEEIREGQSYSGEELVDLLGGEEAVGDRLHAIGNDKVRLLLADEGNDVYKVLHLIKLGEN